MSSIDSEYPVPALERVVGDSTISTSPPDGQKRIARPATIESERRPATETLRVSAHSRPSAVAGAIAGVIREHREVDVQAIGAGATNQSIKAVAIARSYLIDDGIDICCVPSFIDVIIDGQERTAVRLYVHQYTPEQLTPIIGTNDDHNRPL